MEIREQQQFTLPTQSSAISYPSTEPDRTGQDGAWMEGDDEVRKHPGSQAWVDYQKLWKWTGQAAHTLQYQQHLLTSNSDPLA